MKLLMYLGNDLIESVAINSQKITEPGYLRKLTRELKEKHALLLQDAPEEAEFLIGYRSPIHSSNSTSDKAEQK